MTKDQPSILIANRGEIACRIAETCRRMGLRSVAVYSEADAGSRHVEIADKAVAVGPAAARQSYLDMDAILGAARATGAKAVHPGYGFLAENAEFARRVRAEGLIWIGPAPEVIEAMGDKERARKIAAEAGVPVLPASRRYGLDEAEGMMEEAAEVGFPLLVKAAAGGGGIGMSRVDAPEDLSRVVAATQSMAAKAFGDPSIYLERYVPRARHIEVQVFGFGGGAGVHLFDRDCSIQRRFQKIVEEAPAPDMPENLRDELQAASVALVRHQCYEGAGTVEFIYDTAARQAYFLEMNTRIQVEHPVTEMITGIDLVAWQIDQAFGRLAPVKQADIRASGHAIECRIYAERPEKNFMPAPGKIGALDWPVAGQGLRIDAGFRAGDTITPFYDPMIGKLIAHGADRDAALARLQDGLAELVLEGLRSNREFLVALLADPAFGAAEVSTAFVGEFLARSAAERSSVLKA